MVQDNFDGRLIKMERWMVIVVMGGRHFSHFFQYKENAISFLETITETYSAKLYVYQPDYDTWEAADLQINA